MKGHVKNIHERGFGFIRADDGREYFFHFRALAQGLPFSDQLVERRVEFELVEGPDNRPRAENIRPVL